MMNWYHEIGLCSTYQLNLAAHLVFYRNLRIRTKYSENDFSSRRLIHFNLNQKLDQKIKLPIRRLKFQLIWMY